jgi:cytochrome b6-f complex iron-sulfur subunit
MNRQNTEHHQPTSPLEKSPRFEPTKTRRDFLGLAAVWSAMATLVVATIGALRLPMPAVFPESNPKVKIGPPEDFPKGSATYLVESSMWVFRNDKGEMHAISAVCTHLGCIVKRQKNGRFLCPCHGSVFGPNGKVIAGPAPTPLNWLEMSIAPDGRVVVDKMRTVRPGKSVLT